MRRDGVEKHARYRVGVGWRKVRRRRFQMGGVACFFLSIAPIPRTQQQSIGRGLSSKPGTHGISADGSDRTSCLALARLAQID